MKRSILDRTIGFFSPGAEIDRLRHRLALDVMVKHRNYEGAARGRRTEGWRLAGQQSAASTTIGSLSLLRDRSRDLIRNNPFAAKAAFSIPANMVGEGVIPQAQSPSEEKSKKIEQRWAGWGESSACDADDHLDFYGLQYLVARGALESGDIFARRVRRKYKKGQVNFKIQLLEADFVDHMKNLTLDSGNYVVQGVEFNRDGDRTAYWIFPQHPGGNVMGTVCGPSQRVPAADIIPCFRKDRPGQVRGVPWAAPIMLRLRDFDEYEDAQIMKQKIAACYTAIITKNGESFEGDGDSDDVDRLEPGAMFRIAQGEDIKFSTPPSVDGYSDFSKVTLQAVAAGFGITYEMLSSDLSNTSFSSGRLGYLETNRNIKQWRNQVIVNSFCKGVYKWFLEDLQLSEGIDTSDVYATWTQPKRESIDPEKEMSADRMAVRMGVKTVSEVIRSYGADPAQVFGERSQELAKLKELNITTDSDPSFEVVPGQQKVGG